MYYKIINDRTVFSDCKTIQMPDGTWISNPNEEQIAGAGWSVYVPPEVLPSHEEEPKYEEVIVALKKLFSSEVSELSDEDALEVAALFPTYQSKIGEQVNVGDRVWYDGVLYKAIQAHVAQDDWRPDTANSLYTVISVEEWPEFILPTGASDAYMAGDKVTFEGNHYICIMDNTVWSPSVYPQAWELQ